MDGALRAAAEKRRAEQGADFAIPPATLRALQQEAARAYPEDAGEESSPGWLSALWPKLGIVAALAGLAALAVVFFDARPGRSFDLASEQPSRSASPRDTRRLADAETPEEESRLPQLAKTARSDAANFGAAPGAAPPAPSASPEQSDALAVAAAPSRSAERSLALLTREESSQAKAAPNAETLARQQPVAAQADRASDLRLQGGTAPESPGTDKYGFAASDAAPPAPAQLGVELKAQSAEARRFAGAENAPPAASAAAQPLASALPAAPAAEAPGFAGTTFARSEPPLNTPAVAASSESALPLQREMAETEMLQDAPENAPFNRGFAALQSPSYYFTQTPAKTRLRPNLNSPPMPQVLNFFAVQNAGNALRIRDSDGSIYEGAILPAVAAQEERTARDASAQAQEANEWNFFSFRAFGLNQTLQQNVEVSGSVIPQALPAVALKEQVPAQAGRAAAAAAAPVQALKNAPDESLFQNSRIEGTVTVGNNRIRIEARQVATPPPAKK